MGSLSSGAVFVGTGLKVSAGAVVVSNAGVGHDAAGAVVTTASAPTFVVSGVPCIATGGVAIIAKASAVAPLNQQNAMQFDANGRLVTVDVGIATAPLVSAAGLNFDATGALVTSP
jgi:hypothetical protein